MNHLRRAIAVVVLVAAGGMAASIASAGQPPPPGQLDVTVVVGGDAGGDPSDIRVDISRNSGGGVVDTGFGSGSFTLDRGAYVIAAIPVAEGYTIDSIACTDDRNGNTNGGPDFVINGPGDDGVPYAPATCVVTATYTAPPEPTVPPTEPTVPPTEPTVPPTEPPPEPTVPPTEPTVPATTPPTTDDQAAVPPAAPETPAPPVATAAPTIPVTGATDQTLPIALLAFGLTMLGTGALVIARRN